MTAREATKILGVTRKTLDRYVKRDLIRVTKYQMPHRMGWNNYEESDVLALMGAGLRSKDKVIVAYVRITGRGLSDESKLQEQISRVKQFSAARGISIDRIYTDRSDSMTTDFQKRPGLTELMEAVLRGEISAIVMDTKCRLSRFGFEIYEHTFKYHGTTTVIVNKVLGDPVYQAEQSDDIAEVLAKAKIERLGK